MVIRKYFFWNGAKFRRAIDPRNVPLYLFMLVVFAIAWSGVKTIQDNYELQKKISVLKQQNEVLALQNGNAKLQNKYYDTTQYLDLAARQSLGLAGPGEKVILISSVTAKKYLDKSIVAGGNTSASGEKSKYAKNFQAWRDFLLGRKIISD